MRRFHSLISTLRQTTERLNQGYEMDRQCDAYERHDKRWVGNLEGIRPFGRHGRIWEDIIKINLKNKEMQMRVGFILTICTTSSF
jgi:hypothetical protein